VLLVGCGALGTHLAEFCVRAGVGSLTMVDRDVVEFSNLQRQGLFTEADARAGTPKAVAAAGALAAIDSSMAVRPLVTDFTHENAEEIAEGFSGGSAGVATLILDATDNFETRFLINDLACELGIPWVYAGCVGSRAVCMPVVPGETACLACVLEDVPPASGESCETAGIIMPAVLAAVAMASAEAMKLMLAGPGSAHSATIPRMRTVDVWTGELSAISATHPRRDCPVCVGGNRPHLSGRAGDAAMRLCGRNAVQLRPAARLDAAGFVRLADRLAVSGWPMIARNEFLVRIAGGSRGDAAGLELTVFADGRMLVSGTEDFAVARGFASRVVG
jgi:adenylyltransferase/sulfurtransferase